MAHDERSLQQRLEDLAAGYAARGDVRSTVLATWAAQLQGLDELLWAEGLAVATEPHSDLAVVGEGAARAIEAAADEVTGPMSPAELVALALRATASDLPDDQGDAVVAGLGPLAHLAAVAPPSGHRAHTAADRLEERTAEELVVELLATAADCMAVAHELVAEEEHAAAERMARQADVATFEAYLVAAASLGGDTDLASVQVRWDLAQRTATREGGPSQSGRAAPPSDATEVSARVARHRRRLVALLGAGEQGVLQQTFESAP